MKQKKIIIWDLFGGGCNSVSRAIKKYKLYDKYFVYTFDVVNTHKKSYRGQLNYDFQKYINIDLSQDNICEIFSKLIKKMILKSLILFYHLHYVNHLVRFYVWQVEELVFENNQ